MLGLLLISAGGRPAQAKPKLSGMWELESLTSDRRLDLKQRGRRLRAHRLIWTEFEGRQIKLEHSYRGTLRGRKITGKLYVKEPGSSRFSPLRAFKGKILGPNNIILDGMPLKRAAPALQPVPQAKPGRRRPRVIHIDSVPRAARVYLGKRRLGKTPLKLRKRLRPGRQYKLSLRRRGYRPAEYVLAGDMGWRTKGEPKVLKISVPLKKAGETTMDW